MKLDFIKTRGRPPKHIKISMGQMDVLRLLKYIVIPGYIVKVKDGN